jgi:hypothetical protein
MKPLIWHNCYEGSWRDLIVPDAFAHPAKFSPTLVRRIYTHGLDVGWWRPGDVIGDPFGGIAGGGIMAGYAGFNWFGVELEPKFVELGNRNLALHGPKWCALGQVTTVKLVQGDSRRFAEIVGEAAAVVTSPPFGERTDGGPLGHSGITSTRALGQSSIARALDAPGQIEALPTGSVDAVLTSPPYAETLNHGGGPDTERDLSKRSGGSLRAVKTGYGGSAGQIGHLPTGTIAAVVTSPPYAESDVATNDRRDGAARLAQIQAAIDRGEVVSDEFHRMLARGINANSNLNIGGYGHAEGQIGALKGGSIDAVVTSPPWEDQESAMNAGKFKDPQKFAAAMSRLDGEGGRNGTTPKSRLAQLHRQVEATYGEADGQIGNITGETYWEAMRAVYGQCLLALKPGGVMAVVVKDYVKDKQRVPLCDQTLRLVEHLGFEPVCRIHAMLVKERRHAGLFHEHVERRERKSFFRRLAEKKGSPRIDYEEVLVVRKDTSS